MRSLTVHSAFCLKEPIFMITESPTEANPQPRPLTGKEARKMRSAKVKTEVENNNPIYDDDFYK